MMIKKVGIANKVTFQVKYDIGDDKTGRKIVNTVKFGQAPRPTLNKKVDLPFNQNKWNQEEISQFLDAAHADDNGLMFEIVLYTDLRRNELCALKWSDIDLSTGKIKVNNIIIYLGGDKYYISPLRNKRVVSIPNEIIKANFL